MSKAVLISIRPEWCEKIAFGKKTIEVRKTRPKLTEPFKCYIYMTKTGHLVTKIMPSGNVVELNYKIAGKVIGEFVCDTITTKYWDFIEQSCCSVGELHEYANGKEVYGWHISELKIYDTPKELSEFHRPCAPACNFSEECGGVQDGEHCLFPIKRPPQSWCYVEGLC